MNAPAIRAQGWWLLGLWWAIAWGPPAAAQWAEWVPSAPAVAVVGSRPDVAAPAGLPATLSLNQRRIVEFRVGLLGDSAVDRKRLAEQMLAFALARGGAGHVRVVDLDESLRFELDGHTLFFLVPGDLGLPRAQGLLWPAGDRVLGQLQRAVAEHREARDTAQQLRSAARALAAVVLGLIGLRLLFWLRRRLVQRIERLLPDPAQAAEGGWRGTTARHLLAPARAAIQAMVWLLVIVLLDVAITDALRQFPYTRPWAERSTQWLVELVQQLLWSMAGAVPGLVVATLIWFLARIAVRLLAALLDHAQQGELRWHWLDRDTVLPTRRVGTVVIWLFALAMAYPYLPGAHSEAFQGVSVLAGLMLSLGASGVVGQVLAGFSLMVSRSLRVGEYVKVGETEGTVSALGLFTTRIHTGLGEEVSLPNAVVFGQPIRNFSRLVQDGHFMLHATVTIGYGTPWRQVHALLLEAARRTPAVAVHPMPYVVQTSLSDFYVEYRLCAQSHKGAPRRRIEAQSELLAQVQDVFNENGVQILSPHYLTDPDEPQTVGPGPWSGPRQAPVPPPVPAPPGRGP